MTENADHGLDRWPRVCMVRDRCSGHRDGFDLLMFLLAPAMVPVALGCLAVDAASLAFGWFVIESWRWRRAGRLLPSDRFCRRVTVAG